MLKKKFPDILMVGITGSVAAGYPKDKEDIDLMVITKNGSLWLNRLKIKMWLWVNNIPQRGYGDKEEKNDFCFNLWLEEESLKLPENRKNLKNAMDLVLMKVMFDKNKTYERFVRENEWVKKYVATEYNKIVSNFKPLNVVRKQKIYLPKKVFNQVAYRLQYIYMKNKLTEETVDLKRAFFHPKSRK
jgi:hypothetical protein